MKTGSKISIIATLSTLALVGTAFAAWEFNQSASANANSNVTITAKSEVGTLEVNPATFYLTLDHDFIGFTSSDHTDGEAAVTDGLTQVTLKYTGSAQSNDVSDVTIEDPTFVVDAALANYVSITGGSLATPTVSANVKQAVYTLPTVSWVDGKKPTTKAQYDAMKTALASAKVAFTFEATVA